MNLALDYDGTITEDFDFWFNFIDLSITHGHSVFIVTARHSEPSGFTGVNVSVICTKGQQKSPFCQSIGINIDVWIDDMPETIPSYADTGGQLIL